MHVGNDIVDLCEENQRHHPRFPRRALCDEEYETYKKSSFPQKYLWMAWSAKESGFKIMKQMDRSLRFIPSNYVFDHLASTISYEKNIFAVQHSVTDKFIHCHTQTEGGSAKVIIKNTDLVITTINPDEYEHSLSDESNAARALIKHHIARQTGQKPQDIIIQNSNDNIPEIYVDQAKLDRAISISHHGRFVAVAIADRR